MVLIGIQLEKSLPTFDKVNDLSGIMAMKIEKTPIQFLHVIFTAVTMLRGRGGELFKC